MAQQTAEWVVDLSNPNADKITSDSTTNVSISNKQSITAVEWLKKELEDYGSNSHLSLDWNTFDELCEQAKELDKEQSIQ